MAPPRKIPIVESHDWTASDKALFDTTSQRAGWTDAVVRQYEVAVGAWIFFCRHSAAVTGPSPELPAAGLMQWPAMDAPSQQMTEDGVVQTPPKAGPSPQLTETGLVQTPAMEASSPQSPEAGQLQTPSKAGPSPQLKDAGCLQGFEETGQATFITYARWLSAKAAPGSALTYIKSLLAFANQAGLDTQRLSGAVAEWRLRDPALFNVPKVKAPDRRFKAPDQKLMAPVDLWPEAMRARWRDARAGTGVGIGLGAGIGAMMESYGKADATWRNREQAIGRYIAWCTSTGRPFDLGPGVLRAYIADLKKLDLSSRTIKSYVEGLYEGLSMIYPKGALRHIKQMTCGKAYSKQPKRINNKPADYMALVGAGEALFLAGQSETHRNRQALMLRDAAMILFLCAIPLRAADMTGLRLDDLVGYDGAAQDDGCDGLLDVEPQKPGLDIFQHKTGTTLSFGAFPDFVALVLSAYLARARPVLLAGNSSDYLWISNHGASLSGSGLSTAIKARTKSAFGIAVNPHLVRTMVTNFMLFEAPESHGLASRLLGHTSPKSLGAYAARGASIGASKQLASMITALRARARQSG